MKSDKENKKQKIKPLIQQYRESRKQVDIPESEDPIIREAERLNREAEQRKTIPPPQPEKPQPKPEQKPTPPQQPKTEQQTQPPETTKTQQPQLEQKPTPLTKQHPIIDTIKNILVTQQPQSKPKLYKTPEEIKEIIKQQTQQPTSTQPTPPPETTKTQPLPPTTKTPPETLTTKKDTTEFQIPFLRAEGVDTTELMKQLKPDSTVKPITTKVEPISFKKQLDLAKQEAKERGIKIKILDEKGNKYDPYYGVSNAVMTTIHNLFSSSDANPLEMTYGAGTQALMSLELPFLEMSYLANKFGKYINEYYIKPLTQKGYIPEPERKKQLLEEVKKEAPKPIFEPKKENNVNIAVLREKVDKDDVFTLEYRVKHAYRFFREKGLGHEQTLGIIGALLGESNLNPYAVNPKSGALGIAQWLGDRKYDPNNNIKVPLTGNPVIDFEAQLEYIWHELQNKEARSLNRLYQTKTAWESLVAFTDTFLRPAEHEKVYANRYRQLNNILRKIKSSEITPEENLKVVNKYFYIKNWDDFIKYEKKLEELGRVNENKLGYLIASMRGSVDSNTLNETLSAFGSTLFFLPVGFLVSMSATALGASTGLAMTLGSATSGILEATVEAGAVYNEIEKNPNLADKVHGRVLGTLFSNVVLNTLMNRIGYFEQPFKKWVISNRILNYAKNTALEITPEVIQETAQQMIQNAATERPLFEGVQEQIVPVILSTFAFQKFINTVHKIDEYRVTGKYTQEDFDKAFREAVNDLSNQLKGEIDFNFIKEVQQVNNIQPTQPIEPVIPTTEPVEVPLTSITDTTPTEFSELPKKNRRAFLIYDIETGENRILTDYSQTLRDYEPVIEYGEIKNVEELNQFKNLVENVIKSNKNVPINFLVFSKDPSIQAEIDIILEKFIAPYNQKFTNRKPVNLNLVSQALFEKSPDDLSLRELAIVQDTLFDLLYNNNVTQASVREIQEYYWDRYEPDTTSIKPLTNDNIAVALFGKHFDQLEDRQKAEVLSVKDQLQKENKWFVATIQEIRNKIYKNGYVTIDQANNRDLISKVVFNKNYDSLEQFEKLQVDYAIKNLTKNKTTRVFPKEIIEEVIADSNVIKITSYSKIIPFIKKLKSKLFGIPDTIKPFENVFVKKLTAKLRERGINYITLEELEEAIRYKDELVDNAEQYKIIALAEEGNPNDPAYRARIQYYTNEAEKLARRVANYIANLRKTTEKTTTQEAEEKPTEVQHAEEVGSETTPTSPEERTDRGETQGIHIRDTQEDRVDTKPPEEEKIPEEVTQPVQPEKIKQPAPAPKPQLPENAITGKEVSIKTPITYRPIKIKYAVVEADDIQTSHDPINFQPNSKYTAYQPRERSSSALQEQVIKIANNLQPEFLAEDNSTTGGRPILDRNLNVESGNGRMMAIKRAYQLETEGIKRYRSELVNNRERLKDFGFTDEQIDEILKLKQPVLVGIRISELSEEEVKNYIEESNKQGVASASLLEVAKSDVKKIRKLESQGERIFTLYEPNYDLSHPQNFEFVRKFYNEILDVNERNQYLSGNTYTDILYDRIENALFYYAISNDKVGKLFIEGSETGRRIINAINKVVQNIVYAQNNNQIKKYDISEDIAKALEWVFTHSKVVNRDGYSRYEDYEAQLQLFGEKEKLDEISKWLANFFVTKSNNQAELTRFFKNYYQLLYNLVNRDFFLSLPEGVEELYNKNASKEEFFNKFIELYKNKKIEFEKATTLIEYDELDEKLIPADKRKELETIIDKINDLFSTLLDISTKGLPTKRTINSINNRFNTLSDLITENSTLNLTPIERKQPKTYYDYQIDLEALKKLANEIRDKYGKKGTITEEKPPKPPEEKKPPEEPPAPPEEKKPTEEEKPPKEEKPKGEKTKINREELLKKSPLDMTPEELEEYEKILKEELENPTLGMSAEPISKGQTKFNDLSTSDKLRIIQRLKVVKEFESKFLNNKKVYEVTIDEFNEAVERAKKSNFNVDFGYFEVINFAIQEGIKEAVQVVNKVKKERAEFERKVLDTIKKSKNVTPINTFNELLNLLDKYIKTKESEKVKSNRDINYIKGLKLAYDFLKNEFLKTGKFKPYYDIGTFNADFDDIISTPKYQEIIRSNIDTYNMFYETVLRISQALDSQKHLNWINEFVKDKSHPSFRKSLLNKIKTKQSFILKGIKLSETKRLTDYIATIIKTIEKYSESNKLSLTARQEIENKLLVRRLIDAVVYEKIIEAIENNKEISITEIVQELNSFIPDILQELSKNHGINYEIEGDINKQTYISTKYIANEVEKLTKIKLREYAQIMDNNLSYNNSLVIPDVIVINENLLPKEYNVYVKEGNNEYDSPDFILDKNQILGINLALNSFIDKKQKGFMLCDGTGLGKTAQLLVVSNEYIKHKKDAIVFIVVPNKQIADGSYKSDAEKLKIKNIVNLSDSKEAKKYYDKYGNFDKNKLEKGKIYITTYNYLNKMSNINIDLLVLDESHKLKNIYSNRTQYYMKLKADKKLFVTATPTDKIVGFAYFIADMFGNKTADEVLADFGLKLIPVYDPDTNAVKSYILQPIEGISYRQIIENILKYRDELIRKGMLLRRETRFLGKINLIELEADEELQNMMEEIYTANLARFPRNPKVAMGVTVQTQKKVSEMHKAKLILDRILKDIEKGEKVIIVGDYHDNVTIKELGYEEKNIPSSLKIIMNELDKRGIKYSKILGKENKSEEIRKFQNDEVNVAVMTPASGGVGVNLDDRTGKKPRKMYIVGLNFAGDVFEQLIGRVSRRTTRSFSEINICIFNNLKIDDHVREILQDKLSVMWATQLGLDPDDAVVDVGAINTHQDINDADENIEPTETEDRVLAFPDTNEELNKDEIIDEIDNSYDIQNDIPIQESAIEEPQTYTIDDQLRVTLRQVLAVIMKNLGIRGGWTLRTGGSLFSRIARKLLKSKARGLYISSLRLITFKNLDETLVALHEIAHFIDFNFIRSSLELYNKNIKQELINEIEQVTGKNTREIFAEAERFIISKGDYPNIEKKPIEERVYEIMAEGIKDYIIYGTGEEGEVNEFREKCPNFYFFLEKLIDAIHDEFKDVADIKGAIQHSRELFALYQAQSYAKKLSTKIRYGHEEEFVHDYVATGIIARLKNLVKSGKRTKNEVARQVFSSLHNIKEMAKVGRKLGLNEQATKLVGIMESLLGNAGKITMFLNKAPFKYEFAPVKTKIGGVEKVEVELPFVIDKSVKPLSDIFIEAQKLGKILKLETYLVAKRIQGWYQVWTEASKRRNELIKQLQEEQSKPENDQDKKLIKQILKEIDELNTKIEHYSTLVAKELSEIFETEKIKKTNTMPDYERIINEIIQETEDEDTIRLANDVYKYIDALNEYLISTGLYNREFINELKANDPYYIPFYRHLDEWENSIIYPKTGSQIQPVVREVIKPIKGSIRRIKPIFENLVILTQRAIANGERNRALSNMVTFLTLFNDQIQKTYRKGSIKEIKQLEKLLEKYPALKDRIDSGLIVEIAPKLPDARLEKGEIEIKVNGKRQYYQIPVDLYEDFFAIDNWEVNNVVLATLIAFSAGRRAFLTAYNLGFGLVNFIARDLTSILARSESFVSPLKAPARLKEIIENSDEYLIYLASGGDISFLSVINEKLLKPYLVKHKGHDVLIKSRLRRYTSSPAGLLMAISDIVRLGELGGRTNVFIETLKKTKNIYSAVEQAHNVLGNYALGGVSRIFRNYFAMNSFLLPNLKHANQDIKATPKVFTTRIFRMIGFISLPAFLMRLLMLNNDDDREYLERLNPIYKRFFYIIKIPFLNTYVKLPKGLWGFIFGTSAETLAEYVYGMIDDKEVGKYGKDFAEGLMEIASRELNPISSWSDLAPDIITVFTNTQTNFGERFGKPTIESVYKEKIPPEFRLESRVRPTSIIIASALNKHLIKSGLDKVIGTISPQRLEYALRYYVGEFYDLSSIYEAIVFGEDINSLPFDSWKIVGVDYKAFPIINRLLIPPQTHLRSEEVAEFYKQLDEMGKLYVGISNAMLSSDKMDLPQFRKVIEAHLDDKEKIKKLIIYNELKTNFTRIKNTLADIRHMRYILYYDHKEQAMQLVPKLDYLAYLITKEMKNKVDKLLDIPLEKLNDEILLKAKTDINIDNYMLMNLTNKAMNEIRDANKEELKAIIYSYAPEFNEKARLYERIAREHQYIIKELVKILEEQFNNAKQFENQK